MFFLDEATGALDIKMKREIQDLIIKIASETEHTIINVTHSLEEALYISNKIFILQLNPSPSTKRWISIMVIIQEDVGFSKQKSIVTITENSE